MSRRIGIAAALWAFAILLSRVVGLVREAVFGRLVGGGAAADVYQAAFTLPDFLNYLLAAGALSIVFIPIFGGHLARGDETAGWRSFSTISTFLALLLAVGTALAWLAVPWFDAWWFAGFDGPQRAELDALTRVVLPAQVFHVLGGLLSAALQAKDRHALPALAPLVYTGCTIAGGLIGGPEAGAWGFAWGVLVGSALGPFGLPLLGCLHMGLRYRPRLVWDQDLQEYLWRSLPIMLGFSIVMWDDWLLKGIGAGLAEGSVSTLMYAKTLLKVPMAAFGLALGAAAFPTLTRLVSEGRPAEAYGVLAQSTVQMLGLALGAQVILGAAGPEIATVIYGERLLPGQPAAIGAALWVMGLGLWAWSAQTVLARGFYAQGKTWLPSVLGSVVVPIAWPMYHLAAGYGTVGLSAASTLAISAYALLLIVFLRRSYPGGADAFAAFAWKGAVSVLLALAVAAGARYLLDVVAPDLGGAVFSLTAYTLDLPGFRSVGARVWSRVRARSSRR
jgi:putative peptidoglycan lipid II flippase